MSFAKTHSGQSYYLKGQIIDVEVDLSRGLHSFSIVGLPDKSVEEAKDRISAAIKNSGFTSPKQLNHRVVFSLAPAHVKKEGSHFDLAMALGYLLANGDIKFKPENKIFVGELSLDGAVRKVHGVLSIILEAKRINAKEIFIPIENIGETGLVDGIIIHGIASLKECIEILNNPPDFYSKKSLSLPKVVESTAQNLLEKNNKPANNKELENFGDQKLIFLEEIIGQPLAKRGLEIAAAGGHNILLTGPPGTGKTMLANSLRSLLPKLSRDQILEVTSIHSIAGLSFNLVCEPPFRAPHHMSSYSSLVGGGAIPKPGEITLAHHGVLFLDEFPEFDRRVIEALRQPLENRVINITRVKGSVYFPASFILVAAMNPCPCGFKTSSKKECTCAVAEISKYKKKISGPILDRIDLSVEVSNIEYSDFSKKNSIQTKDQNFASFQKIEIGQKNSVKTETELSVERITTARKNQTERFTSLDSGPKLNRDMTGNNLSQLSLISPKASEVLLKGAEAFNLSMRSYHRVWRVARTIADLENSTDIKDAHVLEALQYRKN